MMGKISVNELATKLIDRKGLSKKQAAAFVNEMFDIIQRGLEQDKAVKVKGFGTFKIISVDDRESINVNTGERVLIEGHSKITFTPDAVMKELVNKPFSQFETVVLKDGVDFDDMDKEPEDPQVDTDTEEEASSAPLVDFGTETETVQEEPLVEAQVPIVEEQETIVEEKVPLIETPAVEVETEAPVIDKIVQDENFVEENITEEHITELNITEENVEDAPQAEETVEEAFDEEIIYEEESSGAWKIWAVGIVCCLVGFAAGYIVANMMSQQPAVPEEPKQETVAKPQPQLADSVKQEAVPEPEPKIEPKPEPKPEVKPEPKLEPKKEVEPEAKAKPEPAPAPDKYEKMDPRVLHGAYRIVGTDHVEKIKETDNLARICKRTIGPGMECYLEVYNGIKGDADLKPGKDIKIPKLELKKKK